MLQLFLKVKILFLILTIPCPSLVLSNNIYFSALDYFIKSINSINEDSIDCNEIHDLESKSHYALEDLDGKKPVVNRVNIYESDGYYFQIEDNPNRA